ncbi:putative prophage phiRv2 integrase [Tenebrio molitor]|uniref:putative prophage phiRv2 integrase n=1 Tax=Tenebrio molitor TaxID=7067 RepID=UPI0036249524
MASIETYQTKAGRRYMVRYRKPDRRQAAKKGFTTKRDAQLFAATVEVDKSQGTYIDPTAGRTTITELGQDWLDGLVHTKPQTKLVYDGAFRNQITPQFGDMAVAAVTTPMIRTWVARLTKQYKPPTVRRAFRVLSSILDLAVDSRMIVANPARAVRGLPRVGRRKNAYLTYEQVETAAANAGTYRLPIYLAAYCGLRWGEIAALNKDDIDPTGHIRIRHTLTQRGHLSTPKNGQERTVGTPKFLRPLLAEVALSSSGRLFPDMQMPRSGWGWFRAMKDASGLSAELTFHDLRSSAASFAVASGADVKVVQNMLGHASAAMTLDTYADLWPTRVDEVAARIDAARGKALA